MTQKTINIYNVVRTMPIQALVTIVKNLDPVTTQDMAQEFGCSYDAREIAQGIKQAYKREQATGHYYSRPVGRDLDEVA